MSTGSRVVHQVGDRSALAKLSSTAEVMNLHRQLQLHPLAGQRDVVAAARTVLATFNTPRAAADARKKLETMQTNESEGTAGQEITVEVVYDGADCEAVADALNISVETLIQRHTQEIWIAAFGGFAPGFTYCVPAEQTTGATTEQGSTPRWDVPRRSSPRTAVPTGSVALAGGFSAVYPQPSPGGWQLIGHTSTPVWDETAQRSALIAPGDTVHYRAVREQAVLTPNAEDTKNALAEVPEPSVPSTPAGRPVLQVQDSGLQTLFQDGGRPGAGDLGVTTSGAADRGSAWVANSVVGNPGDAVLLENIGGLKVQALTETVVAVTGAESEVRREAAGHTRDVGLAEPVLLKTGSVLTVDPPARGLRSYLGVRGGFAVPSVLGSSSTDLLSGLGPDPVRTGDRLNSRISKSSKLGTSGASDVGDGCLEPNLFSADSSAVNPLRLPEQPKSEGRRSETEESADSGEGDVAVLRCVLGPRADWFSTAEQCRFTKVTWEVTAQSNRVGLRLAPREDTTPLQRAESAEGAELASEGMVTGSVQVPPEGKPVVFLSDHPVTGGYPVIATVLTEDIDVAAQLPPGAYVRFALIDPEEKV